MIRIIGKLDSASGVAKVGGSGARFIDCPACGERLDKEDLAGLLEHEETRPGLPPDEPDPDQD